jgi:putative glycosyltransferase (TIGR04372 family)
VSEIPVRFAASEEARLARMAAKLWGMDENSKIVTLHVRETEDAWDKQNARKRNATVSNYIPAIDFLMSRGYKIIRIGKLPRQRLEYQGLIDLATSPHRTDLLELWLLSRSEFFIGCDSGPTPVAYLLNKPVVLVNIIDPYSIPLRSGSIYILKHVFDRSVDRTLSLQELINEKYLTTIKDINRYAWLENSAEEILEAVKEMHASLSRKFRLCAEQIAFKEKLYSVAEAIKDTPGHKLAFFFGSDPVFVGDGHIAHFYARKHWNTSPILESIGKGK